MELAILVWAISVLGKLNVALTIMMFILVPACFVVGMIRVAEGDASVKVLPWFAGLFLVGSLFVTLPSERTAYIMVGAYAAQKIAQDPKTEQIASKTIDLINLRLDELIKQHDGKK